MMLAFKIGNGTEEIAGRGMGAHWHVANSVAYIATDPLRQDIPWVQVERNGKTVTYIDSEVTPNRQMDEGEISTMDCLDCHSRQGHIVPKPADAIDQAMANDRIAADLPYIKAQSVALLDQRYETAEAGMSRISTGLQEFYAAEYPQILADRQADIDRSTAELQTLFEQTQFPYMRVYWDTYPLDIGHVDFPGCMRCHDGNHLSEAGEAIPAECNLCHSIPTSIPVATAGMTSTQPLHWELGAAITLGTSEMPDSHSSSLWLSEHRFEFDATCDDCHTIANAGGSDDSSFCSNSNCHARVWPYLNIDAPAVRELAAPVASTPERKLPRIPHPVIGSLRCQGCHGLDQLNPYPEDHTDYSDNDCTDCHRPAMSVIADYTPTPVPPPAPTATALPIPLVNHAVMGNENCVACHAPSSNIAPASAIHNGFTNDSCTTCHAISANVAALPTWTATATATSLPATATPTDVPTIPPTATTAPTPMPTATAEPTIALELTATPEPTAALAEPTASAANTAVPVVESSADVVVPSQYKPISHPLAGNENCMACHAVTSPIEPAPMNHSGFAVEHCQGCHLASAE
ncbi:MAG: hypothetical protein R2867_14330 [Caldilineaceae bacterium]